MTNDLAPAMQPRHHGHPATAPLLGRGLQPRFAHRGRGLSLQDSGKHEREIPARQLLEHGGEVQHFGRIGVGRHGCIVVFFACGG